MSIVSMEEAKNGSHVSPVARENRQMMIKKFFYFNFLLINTHILP